MLGLLLINLGTPDAPNPAAVRRFLRELLSDPEVMDVHPIVRWLLINLVILPRRPARSAAAYAQIWDQRGSPLLFHSRDLLAAVRSGIGDGWQVELGMRCGSPSLRSALSRFREAGIDDILVFPLFPQYAGSTTRSAVEEIFRIARELWPEPSLGVVPPFYAEPPFISALASGIASVLRATEPEHVLLSFHGLPERHVRRADATGGHCLEQADCCARITEVNRSCYRAQCFATAHAIADRLDLADDRWSVSFQSRFGREAWIGPHTERVLAALAREGIRRIAVACPAFVADCLETLEEIGIRGRATFLEAGGEALSLVPSLNSSPAWVEAVVSLAGKHAGQRRSGN